MAEQVRDLLSTSLERLQQCLAAGPAGRERDWARRVGDALDVLIREFSRHTADSESPEGLTSEVDVTRPSLARNVEDLRRQHRDFLDRLRAFRKDVEEAGRAAIPDLTGIQSTGRELAAGLSRHREMETDLIQESITTDLGAAD